MKQEINLMQLKSYALNLCVKKRYTEKELKAKLSAYCSKFEKEEPGIIKKTVNRLKELNYIDDLKFAQDYISEKSSFRPKGKFVLRMELIKKGISKDTIDLAFSSLEFDETIPCQRSLEKKAEKWLSLNISRQRQKAFQFLASRGFNSESIYKVLEKHYSNKEYKDYEIL